MWWTLMMNSEEGPDEGDKQADDNLDEMVGAGLIHGLITGKPTASDKEIKMNLICIFNKIFQG